MTIEGQDESYDFGSGAGFYVNATESKWSKHYNMYDYVTKELPEFVGAMFPVDGSRKSITGHSMGGTCSTSYSCEKNSKPETNP